SAFGNVGRVDRTFRNGPSDDGAVSSEPTTKHTNTKAISNAKHIDTSGVPPADERRYITDEVVIRLNGNPSAAVVDALARKHRLSRLESQYFAGMGVTLYRWHIPNGRT